MRHTTKTIIKRYQQAFHDAWKNRHQLLPTPREQDELAFLPAHLEIMETPLSPTPHWAMRIIIALFALALLWSWFGHLDVMAVATGKVVSTGRSKIIQPLETSLVSQLYVRDGQQVSQGELLVQLDSLGVQTDDKKTTAQLRDAQFTAWRSNLLLTAIQQNALPALTAEQLNNIPPERLQAEQAQVNGSWLAYTSQRSVLEQSVRQKQAELDTLKRDLPALKRYVSLSSQRLNQFEQLITKGYVSQHEYLTHQQEHIEAKRNLDNQQQHLLELNAALATVQQELSSYIANEKSHLLEQRRIAQEQIRQIEQDVARAQQRDSLMQLRAPVSGTVQQLAIHTLGGVVTEAQPLMLIVPLNSSFEIEAQILDKDIGFVKEGQTAAIKLTSFPYTRYGYLTGTVKHVSHDAIPNEQMGMVFPAIIELANDTLVIDGTPIRITAGMGVSVEIKTDKRRVIEYLLSPLETHISEAMRER